MRSSSNPLLAILPRLQVQCSLALNLFQLFVHHSAFSLTLELWEGMKMDSGWKSLVYRQTRDQLPLGWNSLLAQLIFFAAAHLWNHSTCLWVLTLPRLLSQELVAIDEISAKSEHVRQNIYQNLSAKQLRRLACNGPSRRQTGRLHLPWLHLRYTHHLCSLQSHRLKAPAQAKCKKLHLHLDRSSRGHHLTNFQVLVTTCSTLVACWANLASIFSLAT